MSFEPVHIFTYLFSLTMMALGVCFGPVTCHDAYFTMHEVKIVTVHGAQVYSPGMQRYMDIYAKGGSPAPF